jgi:hypothetical protein
MAVRSVYGRNVALLHWIDPEWLVPRLSRIFPTDASQVGLRLAGWEGYLALSHPTATLFAVLHDQYLWAVEQLGSHDKTKGRRYFVDLDQRLAEHLMVIYLNGGLDLAAPGMLTDFFLKAPLNVREHAVSFVGRSIHSESAEDLPTEVRARATALFDSRLFLALNDRRAHVAELRGFGWWFSARALGLDWRFETLRSVLSASPRIEGDFLVAEELAAHVEQRPLDVLDCVELLLQSDNPGWFLIGSRREVEAILSATIHSPDEKVRDRAVALVHRLGAMGHREFRRLADSERHTDSS